VLLNVGGKVSCEGGEEDSIFLLVENLLRQKPGPVHGHYRLSSAGSAEDSHRPVRRHADQPTLLRMKEDAPLLQGRVEDLAEVFGLVNNVEAPLRVFVLECGGDVRRIDLCLLVLLAHLIEDFVQRVPGSQHEEGLTCLLGQRLLCTLQVRVGFNLPDNREQFFRDTQTQQMLVLDVFEETALGCACCGHGGARRLRQLCVQDLQGAGEGVHQELLLLCPAIGLIVVIHPRQNVHARRGWVKNNRPIRLIDTNRIQSRSLSGFDALVVDPGGIRLFSKLLNELADLFLLALLNVRERQKEIVGDRNRHVRSSGSNAASNGPESLANSVAKKTVQPRDSNCCRSALSRSNRTATRNAGHANSAVATISPSSVASSKPGSGIGAPDSTAITNSGRAASSTSSSKEPRCSGIDCVCPNRTDSSSKPPYACSRKPFAETKSTPSANCRRFIRRRNSLQVRFQTTGSSFADVSSRRKHAAMRSIRRAVIDAASKPTNALARITPASVFLSNLPTSQGDDPIAVASNAGGHSASFSCFT